ncbi:hypothetical protein G9A89_013728 [Geosiphon pyriformis]|nr:hypothetical protein G9A89_013728 [Geosiphon pyriformis]
MVDTHMYQPCVVISRPLTQQHHSSNSRKKRRNLPRKPTKFPEPTQNTMSCYQYLHEMTTAKKKEKTKEKGKEKKEKSISTSTTTYNSYTTPQQSAYCCPKLVCVDCDKKLSLMGVCCGKNEEYQMVTKFYCHVCIIECFERPK